MLGRLKWSARGRGRLEEDRLYGLPVLQAETDPAGFWGDRRLRRAGRGMKRQGVRRVLVPSGFDRWPLIPGLAPVETETFVRAQSAPLALAALERRGLAPDRATVALRGMRAGREMAQAAIQLCPLVRRLVVSAPSGGEELARWLRREFGVPVLPREEAGQVAIRFHPGCPEPEETGLELYGPVPDLAGLSLSAPALEKEDRENLSLLAALWERGRLDKKDIKIT